MLTELQVRAARPREKAYKLFDDRGLYVIVNKDGSCWWRFKYRFEGREKLLSLGVYPDVPLKRAREKRDEARRLVADGVDPGAKRKAEKAALADTFEAVAREYLTMKQNALARRPPISGYIGSRASFSPAWVAGQSPRSRLRSFLTLSRGWSGTVRTKQLTA